MDKTIVVSYTFGKPLSSDVLMKVNFDADFANMTTGIANNRFFKVVKIIDFIDRAEAESFGEMLALSHYQVESLTVVWEAIIKIKKDPGFAKYRKDVMNGGRPTQTVPFGVQSEKLTHSWLLCFTPAAGLINRENVKTMGVPAN